MQPKVSILLPIISSAETLSDAIDSILNQTFEAFELILIDHRSDEENAVDANHFVSLDPRIKIIHNSGKNLTKKLNSGIESAKSKYIAIMDERDIAYSNRIEKQYHFLESNNDISLVTTQIKNSTQIEFPEEFERLNQYINWLNRIITPNDFSINRFIETPYVLSTLMFRKDLTIRFGGFQSGDYPTEFEFTLRWLDQGLKMCKIPEILCDWNYSLDRFNFNEERFFDQGLFETKSRYLQSWLKENNKYYPEVVVWGAGRSSRQKFYILHELGLEAKFFIDLRANPEHKVIQYQNTPPAGNNFIISYVSNRAAREKIRTFLVELGYIEGINFICVA